jgi:hypothetical protein
MKTFIPAIFLLLAISLAACSPAPIPTATPSNTPEPSPTPDLTATAVAEVTATAEAFLQTIYTDLQLAGFSAETGTLAWVQDEPFEMKVDQPSSSATRVLQDTNSVFSNFVMGVDVQWESEVAESGCEIDFRADAGVTGRYAVFATTRLSGQPSWNWDLELYSSGRFQASLSDGLQFNSAINLSQGGTNHYVLVANGNALSVYANGVLLGDGTASPELATGEISLGTWQQSGVTTCSFSNAWVWDLP